MEGVWRKRELLHGGGVSVIIMGHDGDDCVILGQSNIHQGEIG
jgi:hypothetical protein